MAIRVLAVLLAVAILLPGPGTAAEEEEPDPTVDTGQDLHAALLGSGPPERAERGGGIDLAGEYVTYSLATDGRWIVLTFDVAGAEFSQDWLQLYIAARLMRDGEVTDEWFPFARSVAIWKVFSGPADDPYRNMFSLVQDTPWGAELALPATDVDTMTLLLGVDVETTSDVGLVLALEDTDSPFFGEPFPDAFAQWVDGWTSGKAKVRLIEDAHGGGAQVAVWLGSSEPQDQRDLTIEDERVRVDNIAAAPGNMRVTTRHEPAEASLSTLWLSYSVQAGVQDASFTWASPLGTQQAGRAIMGSDRLTARAIEPATDAGYSSLMLEVDALGPEFGRTVTLIHDQFALDPDEVFGGQLAPLFTSDPPVFTSDPPTSSDTAFMRVQQASKLGQ